jgi:hypothetical protein
VDEPNQSVACKAVIKNGLVLLSLAAASGILVQPLRAATECEVDLVRKRLDHGNGLRPWIPKQRPEFHLCATESHPLTWTSPCEDWSLTSLKGKLTKIGAKVVSHGRYVAFQMAEVAIPRNLFADILRLIAELRPPPAASTA